MQITEYTQKIQQLLTSEDTSNVALAFQLMEGQGIPESLYPLMGDDFYKKTLCIQHGITPPIQNLTDFRLEGDQQQPPRYFFEAFPKTLLELDQLKVLTFIRHPLSELPNINKAWPLLEELDLSANELNELPEDFGNLNRLQQISLADNQLKHLPLSFKKCKQVKELNLSNNQLRVFPQEVLKLTKLEKLDLSHNYLTEIPPEIGKLKKLKELYLNNNQLVKLPNQIARLKNLETIYLSDNQFEEVPKALYQAENLVRLEIKNNPIDAEKIEEAQRLFQFKLTVMIFLLGKKYE